jgi:hypothetical protein
MSKLQDGIYMTNTFSKSVMYLNEVTEVNFKKALKVSESNDDTRSRIIIVINNKIRAVRIPGMLDWKDDESVAPLTLKASIEAFEENSDDDFEVEYYILAAYYTAMQTGNRTIGDFIDWWIN